MGQLNKDTAIELFGQETAAPGAKPRNGGNESTSECDLRQYRELIGYGRERRRHEK